jgi:hypothetical protein
MEIIQYLNSLPGTYTDAFEHLKNEYGISSRVYPDRGIAVLDYNQIESPKTHPLVIQCRGLIIAYPCAENSSGSYYIISRKFPRFFNFGECPEYYSDFKIENAVAYHKEDGSLIGIWYDWEIKSWQISTRGTAFGEAQNQTTGTSYADTVKKVLGVDDIDFQRKCSALNPFLTYCCELVGPLNLHVTRYRENRLVFLGSVSNGICGTYAPEVHFGDFQSFGDRVTMPVRYEFANSDELLKIVESMPDLGEGVVLYDSTSDKRMKLKGEKYVQAHHLRGNSSRPNEKNLAKLIFLGELEEVLCYFPEFAEYAEPVKERYVALFDRIEAQWDNFGGIESQKDFAIAVNSSPEKAVLFRMRSKQCTAKEAFDDLTINAKLALMDIK